MPAGSRQRSRQVTIIKRAFKYLENSGEGDIVRTCAMAREHNKIVKKYLNQALDGIVKMHN